MKLSRHRFQACAAEPGRRGTVSLELMAVLPVFIVLVIGIMEMGMLFHNLLLINLASNEATRAVAVGQTVTSARNLAQGELKTISGTGPAIAIEYREMSGGNWGSWQTAQDSDGTNDAPPRSQVRVTVTYQHPLLAPRLFPGLADADGMQTMAIRGAHVMNRE